MLILFDSAENPAGRLTSRSLISCVQTEPLNGLVMLDFTVDYESLDAMDEVFYVAHKDAVNANAIQMYKIITSAPDNQNDLWALHMHDDMKRLYPRTCWVRQVYAIRAQGGWEQVSCRPTRRARSLDSCVYHENRDRMWSLGYRIV